MTDRERAVIEAARKVFRADGMRERVERLATLKEAVDSLEIEVTASLLDEPAVRDKFATALGHFPQGSRAFNLAMRNGGPEAIAAMSWADLRDIRNLGPSMIAMWFVALEHADVPSAWEPPLGLWDRINEYWEKLT